MGEWGPWCGKCGHPATYHTTSRCLVVAGAFESKAPCDCDGYEPADPSRVVKP